MATIVIGATSFLGAALCKWLSMKGEPVLPMSFRPQYKELFLTKFTKALVAEKPLAVINAGASQTGDDNPEALAELIDSNVYLPAVLGTLILEHSADTRLINFGTSWQIGKNGESSPFNAYAAAKSAVEPFLDHFAQSGLRVATLRLYDTYGPEDKRRKVVNLIADAINSRSVLFMSSGNQLIDLVHVDDVISAVDVTLTQLIRAQEGVHYIYSVRSGKPIKILDVLSILLAAANLERADFIKLGVYSYRNRERFELYADTPTPPGWSAHIDLIEGLKALLQERRALVDRRFN